MLVINGAKRLNSVNHLDSSFSTKLRRLSGSEQSSEFKKPLDRIYSKSASPEKGARNVQRGSSPALVQPGTRAFGEFSAIKEEKANRQAERRRQRRKKIELSFVGYQRFDKPWDLASQDTGKSVTSSNEGRVADEGYLPLFVVQLDDDDSGSAAAARRQAAPNGKTTRQLPVELCASLRPLPGKAFFVLDLQLHLLLGFASVPALRSAYPRLAGRELNLPQKSRMWALMSTILSMPLADEEKGADASEERARAWFCGTVVCFLRLDEVVDIIRRDFEPLLGRLTAVTLDVGLTGAEVRCLSMPGHSAGVLPSAVAQMRRVPRPKGGANADPSRASSAIAPMDRRALSRRPRASRKPFPGLPAKLALKTQRVRLRGDVPDDKAAYGTTSLCGGMVPPDGAERFPLSSVPLRGAPSETFATRLEHRRRHCEAEKAGRLADTGLTPPAAPRCDTARAATGPRCGIRARPVMRVHPTHPGRDGVWSFPFVRAKTKEYGERLAPPVGRQSMEYVYKLHFLDLQLYLCVNEHNIIDQPTSLDEN
ncbi:MAG: hypothetical protein BJ554DRAFT_3394, partial [Olpidium bornovanus]